MASDIREKLDEALGQIDRPGSFCVSGSAPAILPGLEVEGLGPVGLPLAADQAKKLIKHCHQAPYGKGTKTLVDKDVRRVWRMEPDRFSLTNPDWNRFVAETVGKVQEALGLEKQKLESHLYDLLLYEPGGFFLPHRDGEKLDRMVATLVVVLPSAHEGGELVVRHEGEERVIDFGGPGSSPFDLHFAAFYADCEHEVRPLLKGYRLCLVYNLTLAKSKKAITAPRVSGHIEAISPLVREWAEGSPEGKLVVTLDHQYTKDGVAWDALKGVDRVKAQVLAEAARRSGCRAYLGLLTYHESGEAEERSSRYRSRRSRWDEYDDEGDASDYEMGEVYESSLTLEQLSDAAGKPLPLGVLHVEKDELLDPDTLQEVTPEVDFEGYTGNEGMTLDRWYRHAAIVLWPEARHFKILCNRDPRDVVPVLKQMVAEWKKVPAKEKPALKAGCLDLASAILTNWGGEKNDRFDPEDPGRGDLLKSLAALDDAGLIGRYLGDVMIKDASVDPGPSLTPLLQKHGWGTFREELRAAMQATTTRTMERNVRLLEEICSARPRKKEGWDDLRATLAQELVQAIEALDRQPASIDWRSREVKRADVLAGLARLLIMADQGALLTRFVDHALASPKAYPLITAHMPALASLQPWLKKDVKKPVAALTRWVASCREQLEALTAKAPQEPTDFRRTAEVKCKCAECAELNRFLADPKESTHQFRARQETRSHLEHNIRDNKCDLTFTTIRTGSPHILACTKTKASYLVKLKTYHQNLEHLATVRAIEASLPG